MGLTRITAQQISDIDYKQAVRVITLTDITLSGGAPSSVDGVNLSTNDRILVNGQSNGAQNGLYYVVTVGAGSNGTWARSGDANQTGEIEAGMIVMVTEGTSYADTQWKLITNNPITIGTTALVFEQSSAYSFGTITANAVGIVADTVGDTVTFTPGDNFVISGNAVTDTITFGVSQSPTFTGATSVAGLTVTGNITGNLLPSANITYNLGSNTQRWNDIWLANSTIYLGSAQLSANATAVTITNPAGGTTVLAGATTEISAANVTVSGTVEGGNVSIRDRGILYLYDTDSSNYIGHRAPGTLAGNFTYQWPTSYGNNTQVLTTNGAGGLTWEDAGTGGGSGASAYPNSTVQPVPGATGNFDLSYNFAQTVQEVPFEAAGTDPFGVNLGEVYSMMDPVGEVLDPVDLGVLT